eukprot:13245367-Alexandrium_andersonii.AAC.1
MHDTAGSHSSADRQRQWVWQCCYTHSIHSAASGANAQLPADTLCRTWLWFPCSDSQPVSVAPLGVSTVLSLIHISEPTRLALI